MKNLFFLMSLMFLLNGCAESIAFLGSSVGAASNGKIVQSSLNSAISYGIKKQTGKTPLGHALAYAEEVNPEKKKETCISFIEKTRSEICTVVKKQITLTNISMKKKALEIINKTPSSIEITSNIETIDKEKIIKPKKIVVAEKKNFINNLNQFNTSPRKLAIAFQAKIREKTKNNYFNSNLFKR